MSIAAIVVILVVVLVFAVKSGNATSGNRPIGQPPSPGLLSNEDRESIQALMDNGQKIEAIDLCKEATGLGLKESKDLVEYLGKK